MFARSVCVIGLLALLAAAPVAADVYGGSGPANSPALHHRERQHIRFRLAPELKVLWRKEMHSQLRAMPKDQRHGWLRSQWAAMNERQKQTKTAELEAKWKNLPNRVQQAILQKTRERREAHRMRHQEQRGPWAKADYDHRQG